jgi:hypothetical protein
MSDIWRWPMLKLKMAIPSRQRTTISTPNIISDRCAPNRHNKRRLTKTRSTKANPGRVNNVMVVSSCARGRRLGQRFRSGAPARSYGTAGDLFSSFLKRRLNLPPSSRATGVDQIPECLLPTLAIRSTLSLSALDVVSIVIIFFLGQVILSRLFFEWNIRNQP